MKVCVAACALLTLCCLSLAQDKSGTPSPPGVVTVPATIDHNRVVIDAEIPLPDGSRQRVRAWVNNGDPDLYLSRRMASVLGLAVSCDDHGCSSAPPREITVGGMMIPFAGIKEAKIPLRPVSGASVMASGLSAEINVPSTVLRHYDVLIDYPGRKVSIGAPGTIKFRGPSGKVQVNRENGLIQIPSQIEGKKYNLGLDIGASISFLSEELFDKLQGAHPDWPRMTGAVGSANSWGMEDEPKWKLLRTDRVQFGPLFLTNVAFVALPKNTVGFLEKRAGVPTVGLLGANILLNYRVGLDYAHSMVYLEVGRTFNFPDFDVVGLILRPEDDGGFTILGEADFNGQPSVSTRPEGIQVGDTLVAVNDIAVRGGTMGQVWAMLGGNPGQERKLVIERGGRQFTIVAKVQHFLGEVPDEKDSKRKK